MPSRMISSGMLALLRHPQEFQALRVDRVVEAATAGVADWEPDRWRNWRRIAAEGDAVYVMAGDRDGVEVFHSEGVEPGWPESEDDMLRGWEESDIAEAGDGWREIRCDEDGSLLVYPVSRVAAGIIERIDYWLIGKGMPRALLAEWL